jgi:hypothetical protein
MKIRHSKAASRAFMAAPTDVQRAFLKQVTFLKDNLHHPSLHAKKYDQSRDLWQTRVNRDWRFYFTNLWRHLPDRRHHSAPKIAAAEGVRGSGD